MWSRPGALTGASASSRDASCTASGASGIPAPDGRGRASSTRLPARLLQCGATQAHSNLCELPSGSCSCGMTVRRPERAGGRANPQRGLVPGGGPPSMGTTSSGVVAAAATVHLHLPACAPGGAGTASSTADSPSVAARMLGHMQAFLQRGWPLVGGEVPRAGGLCSAWYCGKDPRPSRATSVERWCSRGVL